MPATMAAREQKSEEEGREDGTLDRQHTCLRQFGFDGRADASVGRRRASNRSTNAGYCVRGSDQPHPSSKIARTPSIVTNSRIRRFDAPTGWLASR